MLLMLHENVERKAVFGAVATLLAHFLTSWDVWNIYVWRLLVKQNKQTNHTYTQSKLCLFAL